MNIKLTKEMIAVFMQISSVRDGMSKESKSIKLPEVDSLVTLLENVGALILREMTKQDSTTEG
ncbi:hypothetical protein A73_183 [Escherichia phage A73]|uniref:Uncharacterized protein n=1 Tax=Escherichia phage A73 TaxID=3003819 RepID=A0AAF0AQ22_9CAUD|nr:hypothetical protein A73_183 [Escherichia phage A73]WBF78023.1 hypothetical protein W70_168 [Escherichia phage W70]